MPDKDNVIDVEAVEIEGSDHLPAVIPRQASRAEGTHEHGEPMRKWSEEWWAAQSASTQARRCRAHSSRTGEPCKNLALQGGTACRYHGGAAPHVKAAARARLDNAAEVMAKQLLGLALTAESEGVQLAAVKDALDRTIGKAPTTVEIGPTKPYEEVLEGISTMTRAESRRARGVPDSGGESSSPASAEALFGDEIAAGENAQAYSPPAQPREPEPSDSDRERSAQRRQPPRSQVQHVTGEAAMRLANEANRAIGAMPDQLALESRHKRYPRP